MQNVKNPLGYENVGKLLRTMAIPAILANIMNALYNVVDQIFIGQGVGYLGNAATNIAFPITTICLSLGVMIGIGTAANFNLSLGRGNQKRAEEVVGTSFVSILTVGVILCLIIRTFLEPMMILFGATEEILPYAMEYTKITSLGIPLFLLALGTNPLIRADRSPKYAMLSVMSGAILNVILDAIFIFGFGLGISGAAWATVISQALTAIIVIYYYTRFNSIVIKRENFKIRPLILRSILALGMASFIYQISTTFVQVITNNMLNIYGGQSIYGSDIAIAIAGIVLKTNTIFIAIVLGIVQGSQPIISFNYGAQNYSRVKETLKKVLLYSTGVAIFFFTIFQLLPKEIISIFGGGSELYYDFGVKYMRIFFGCLFLNGLVIASSTFFPSIGKAKKGAFISLMKQIIILIPLVTILPKFFGVEGIIYSMPIADVLAFIIAGTIIYLEIKSMPSDKVVETISS